MAEVKILAPFILWCEGGFVNDQNDLGGATNKGVTLNTWRAQGYDKNGDGDIDIDDLIDITDEDVVNIILKPNYWDRCQADKIKSQSVANIIVDWVWGSGSNGIKGTQRVVGATPDGIFGEHTLAAVNGMEPRRLFAAIKRARVAYIQQICKSRPKNKKYLKGWLRRVNAVNYGSLTYNGKAKYFRDI